MFTDQLGNPISLPAGYLRIISLVPSQTELLYDLGLDSEVVGITKFCVHPESWHRTKTKVGGTKDFRFDVIDLLNPDLIIGNKEENYLEGIERLKMKYPVWMSDIATLEDALSMIYSVGVMVGREARAKAINEQIKANFAALKKRASATALYLIWKGPWMAAGRSTFVNTMMERLGLTNATAADRYPQLKDEDIRELSPEIILLSSEPFPFRQKHVRELRLIVPDAKILLVDGEFFSWYGSRLIQAPEYFSGLEL